MKRTRVWMVVFGALFLTVVGCSGGDGMDGTSCTVTEAESSDEVLIECEDGTTATVSDGADGQGARAFLLAVLLPGRTLRGRPLGGL